MRLLKAFEDAGVPLEALVAASDAGQISLRYYGELHPPPSPVSGRSFAEFAASLGEGRRHLGQLFAAFGIAEPDDAVVLTVEDEAVIREVLDVVVATGQPDLALRAVRMFGEGRGGPPTRRSGSTARPSAGSGTASRACPSTSSSTSSSGRGPASRGSRSRSRAGCRAGT